MHAVVWNARPISSQKVHLCSPLTSRSRDVTELPAWDVEGAAVDGELLVCLVVTKSISVFDFPVETVKSIDFVFPPGVPDLDPEFEEGVSAVELVVVDPVRLASEELVLFAGCWLLGVSAPLSCVPSAEPVPVEEGGDDGGEEAVELSGCLSVGEGSEVVEFPSFVPSAAFLYPCSTARHPSINALFTSRKKTGLSVPRHMASACFLRSAPLS